MEQYFAVLTKGSFTIVMTIFIVGAAIAAVMVELLLLKWAIVETWRKLQRSLTTAAYERLLKKKIRPPAPTVPRPASGEAERPQETLTDNVRKISNGTKRK